MRSAALLFIFALTVNPARGRRKRRSRPAPATLGREAAAALVHLPDAPRDPRGQGRHLSDLQDGSGARSVSIPCGRAQQNRWPSSATGPGRCPIDGTPLVQVTAAVSWTLPRRRAKSPVSPGTCPDGSPKTRTFALRAHGNHNPQHGGLFFMAARQHAPSRRRVPVVGHVPDVLLRRVHEAAEAHRGQELQGHAEREGREDRQGRGRIRWSAAARICRRRSASSRCRRRCTPP